MRWLEGLLTVDGQLSKSGCFAANYWVTGKIMPGPESSDRWQPRDSIFATSFQILKMGEYHSLYGDEDDKQLVQRLLEKVGVSWLQELNKLDKRATCAWPHAKEGGINTFRLDDHFWVWKALKTIEDIQKIGGSYLVPAGRRPKAEKDRVSERLLSSNVQREVLQRFATENDISRKQMLAVARSARESRFLFHARDTALFYGHDCGFFLPGSFFDQLWENTIEAQCHHHENEETSWGNSIRYALGIMVGTRDRCLNKKSAAGLAKRCVEVLIRSGGHNGFFPGQLDETTKEPTMFYSPEDMDFYYHANFEINYILLTHARQIDGLFRGDVTHPQKQQQFTGIEHPQEQVKDWIFDNLASELAEILAGASAQPKQHRVMSDSGDRISELASRRSAITERLGGRRDFTMKKAIPFSSLIDARSITNLDEEWLYNYPEFLSTEKINLIKQINSLLKCQPSSEVVGGIIAQTLQRKQFSYSTALLCEAEVWIADTPKQKHLDRQEKREFIENPFFCLSPWELLGSKSHERLCSILGAARTAETAKKRFIWLPHANEEVALLCWAATPDSEKSALSLFFDRHSKCEKHVWDDTTMVLNTWQTELHLSFYVLVDAAAHERVELPPLSRDTFPGTSKKEIRRASIGFRFDGDFFDRYWTCHFIEHIPGSVSSAQPNYPFKSTDRHTEKQWGQRKVLELHLLDRILIAILNSSLGILEEVRKELGVENSTLQFSVFDSDRILTSKEDDSQKFEQLLQAVDEDLTSVLNTLQKWSTREKDRGQEQPRWTHNDERKYRGAIKKLQGSTERHVKDLEIRRDNIRKLKVTLTTRREKIRRDLEFRWNENIRYFTYVTVIFLPLGFAASFYSMSGAPDHGLVLSLVKFAIAAFAVTVVFIVSAKSIFSAVKKTFSAVTDVPAVSLKQATKKSLLIRKHQKEDELTPHAPGQEDRSPTEFSRQKSQPRGDRHATFGSPVSFWLAYIFVEVPARMVLRAVFALKRGRLSGRAVANVVLGVLFMPVFGTSWLLRFIGFNILDFTKKLLGKCLNQCCPKSGAVELV